MRFTPELEKLVNRSISLATDRHHEFVTLEHLLLAGLEDVEILDIVQACGGDEGKLREKLEKFLREQHTSTATSSGNLPQAPGQEAEKPSLTVAFHRVIQRAVLQVESSGRELVTSGNLLISLLKEDESHAVYFLGQEGITRFDVISYFSHGLPKEAGNQEGEAESESSPEQGKAAPREKTSPLKSFTVNLNERAKNGLIDPLIGRDDVLERVAQVLSRRTKNNVLLVGEAGVGKTAIADGLAARIVAGEVPEKLKSATIYSLDMGSLLSGTKYRGDFEARLKGVVKALEKEKGSILFIDEIHTLIGAGAAGGGSVDAANLLKPALASRAITCMGSTTYKEYRAYLEKDQALLRRFQKVDIREPSADDTVAILKGLRPRYEDFHDVKYSDEVVQNIVELSQRYVHSRPLPDKAIDVLDETGSRLRLKSTAPLIEVKVSDVESVVASMAQVPAGTVSSSDREKLQTLGDSLKAVVFGQAEALEKLVAAIKLSRSGLGNAERPIGCFLFTGPTGVGKTESARQLAAHLGTELIRFDMSEYMEKHAVSRLVGAPPGYVGYDEGGLLTESVSKNPYAVLLFDEMEKAHPDISNILLQVMDNGKLTDSNGKVVDFRNVILILTSNVGSREMAKATIGIQSGDNSKRSLNAVKNAFAPEFLNRLDAVVTFAPLSKEIVFQVIEKVLEALRKLLTKQKVELSWNEEVKEVLFTKGYDPAYGARPLSRAVDEQVKKKIVDELLFGKLQNGGRVALVVKNGEIEFKLGK